MKVYVLIGDMGYDGSYLMGVYSSHELAEKAFADSKDRTFLEQVIIEKEIDKESEIKF